MATHMDWPALTHTHPELSFLPSSLRAVTVVHDFDKGETVFRRDARPQAVYFLLTGEVRLVRRSRAGNEVILQRTRRGFFAEASLESGVYHCDAVAARPSKVLRIPLAATREALDNDSTFRRAWIAHLSRELRRARAQGERLALKSAQERILHYLESEGSDGVVTLAVSRKAWAAELGLTHETLYRTLARLEAEGLVIRHGSELRLAKRRAHGVAARS
ncbi:MAG: Crp/Fnr family transcriptional regulator [Gammaproteobacteria bacterium]|nr:MAG: Crp/Fnr family transcriptional regulator [Gammaproteobacteria bacterium]